VPRGNIWTGATHLNGIARLAIAKADGCQKFARRCHVSKNNTIEDGNGDYVGAIWHESVDSCHLCRLDRLDHRAKDRKQYMPKQDIGAMRWPSTSTEHSPPQTSSVRLSAHLSS
jgi:hypothetical protein